MSALDIVVKATALLAAAGSVQAFFRRRGSAAARHLVWTSAMFGLLVLPIASAGLPHWNVPIPVAPAPVDLPRAAVTAAPQLVSVPATTVTRVISTVSTAQVESRVPAWIALAAAGYGAGLVILLVRLGLEPIALRRVARSSRAVAEGRWLGMIDDAARQLRITRGVRLLQSREDIMPMTFGTRRPTVVLPALADSWNDDRRRAVLLHELAHVARHDCFTQILSAIVCAVYWPHPGVWWAARRLRVERELACDDRVLAAGTEARDYAGHLLEIAHSLGAVPAPAIALGMARARQLENRLLAVLDGARNRAALPRRGALIAMAALIAVLVPMAALHAAIVPATREAAAGPIAMGTPFSARAQSSSAASDVTGTWEVRPARESGMVQVTMRSAHGSHSTTVSAARVEELAGQRIPASGQVHFSIRRDAGTFSGDGVCRSGVCGGTCRFEADPKFAAELGKRGVGTPTAQDQFALAMADVGLPYVDGLAAAGYTKPDIHQLVRAAQHGVSLEYVQAMTGLGYRLGTLEGLVRMRDHGVDPEYVRGMAGSGFAGLSVDELVRARDHGVDPHYVSGMRDAGHGSNRLDEMVNARDHGVDPEYVRGMQARGYRGSLEDLIKARDHGVDPEYWAGMAALGYKDVAVDGLIRTRDHGVDPAYVRGLAELGYKGLSLEDLIRMRDHGVDPAYVRRVQEKGAGHLSVDELIQRRDRGQDDPEAAARAMAASVQSFWRSFKIWLRG